MELKKNLPLAVVLFLTQIPVAFAQSFANSTDVQTVTGFPILDNNDDDVDIKKLSISIHKSIAHNEIKSAERYIREALKTAPRSSGIWFNLGALLLSNNQFVQSKHCFEKAIEISPRRAEAYFFLGTIYERLMQIDQANECYKKFLAVFPPYLIDKRFSAGRSYCAKYLPFLRLNLSSQRLNDIIQQCEIYEPTASKQALPILKNPVLGSVPKYPLPTLVYPFENGASLRDRVDYEEFGAPDLTSETGNTSNSLPLIESDTTLLERFDYQERIFLGDFDALGRDLLQEPFASHKDSAST